MSETEMMGFNQGLTSSLGLEETIRVGDPMPRLGSVAHHDGMKVTVSWRSGLRADKADVVDLAPMIMTYKVYRPLRENPELFKSVHLTADGAAIAWGNDDAIDMAATTVERLAEEAMEPSDFRGWLERHHFTYEAAAAQLGISRRLVGYYAGKRRVPRYIALACRYLDQPHSPELHSASATLSGEGTLSTSARMQRLRAILEQSLREVESMVMLEMMISKLSQEQAHDPKKAALLALERDR